MKDKQLKIYLTGGDSLGWALHHEMESTRKILTFGKLTNIINCNVIHSVYWPALLGIPAGLLKGRRIISHLSHDPRLAAEQPGWDLANRLVNLWIVRSERARQQMEGWGLAAQVIPYILDSTTFYFIDKADSRLGQLAETWGIPRDKYLIGSFQRDTEGMDLESPKLVKGPDLFAEIVEGLWRQGLKIHVILAGPRRFWLRRRLHKLGVPFTFVGREAARDDVQINTLARDEINRLYNLIDLYVVSSRMEGGPQAVIEAGGARCKIISSDVGHARDTLHQECIYSDPGEAIRKISSDILAGSLEHTKDYNFQVIQRNLPESVRPLWSDAYRRIREMPPANWKNLQEVPGVFNVCRERLKRYLKDHAGFFFGK
jgi:glycosyltransferase involved in cell wall biosynthesis